MTCVWRTLCLSERTKQPPLAKRVESPSRTGSSEGTFPGWKRPGLIEAASLPAILASECLHVSRVQVIVSLSMKSYFELNLKGVGLCQK